MLTILEEKGPDTVGIFRISSSKAKIESLIKKIDRGKRINFEDYECNVLANTVKQFLREFPDPLLTEKLHEQWIRLTDIPEPDRQLQARKLFHELPTPNALLTYRILRLCALISEKQDKNKMNTVNLAIVFAPNILTLTTSLSLNTMGNENATITYLIENFGSIFEEFKIGEENNMMPSEIENPIEESSLPLIEMPVRIQPTPILSQIYIRSEFSDYKYLREYYQSICGLSSGVYELSFAILASNYPKQGITNLNHAFHSVYTSLKAFLGSLKNINDLLPKSFSHLLNETITAINPVVQGLIRHVKLKNTNPEEIEDESDLFIYCQQFSGLILILFHNFKRFCLLDEITVCVEELKGYLLQLEEMRTVVTHDAFSSLVNNIQFTGLKLTSLLRSYSIDVPSILAKEEIQSLIIRTEEEISLVYDEARACLLKKIYKYGESFKSKLSDLKQTVREISQYHLDIDNSLTKSLDEGNQLSSTIEQLSAIINDHQSNDNEHMQFVVTKLNHIGYHTTQLFRMLGEPWTNQETWFKTSNEIIRSMEEIKNFCDQIKEKLYDRSLQEGIESYSTSVENAIILFKIQTSTIGNGVIISSPGLTSNFVSPLKEFAYITFPFLYILKDALFLLKE
eukprot:TRINITY_DN5307_c0_g1_i1.p1 TRINITY_DN5307_c0_g1~~TRINITY_DN5307_c0_g1_i1.p1  ORF type:complete len:626 (-),score=99.44 TRINITY_DN5307_c0_g1_i1:14-1891(-)